MSTQGRYPPPPGNGPWGPPPGSFSPVPPPPGVPGSPPKPITGSPHSIAMHAITIDPRTGLPRGEKPPASAASVVALVCGILLCLGPFTGVAAIVAGVIARRAAAEQPGSVGGANMALAGILLGVLNLLISGVAILIAATSLAG